MQENTNEVVRIFVKNFPLLLITKMKCSFVVMLSKDAVTALQGLFLSPDP